MAGNRFTKFSGNKTQRSGFEVVVKDDLDARGLSYGFVAAGTYTPDFVFKRADRVYLVVEAKGRFTPADRRKLVDVARTNPGVNIRILFQHNDKLNSQSKTRVSDWAARNGFYSAVGKSIPQAWIENDECPMIILPPPRVKKEKASCQVK
jgi:hypothetical protein